MDKITKELLSNSAETTREFAKELAKKLNPGDSLAIYGPLGAGKTTFIQGLAAGLGYEERVFSPTFVLVRPYKIASSIHQQIKTLYHIDLYRIDKPADLRTIGIEDFLADSEAVCAIEWPEKISNRLPARTIKIKITPVSETERKITISS